MTLMMFACPYCQKPFPRSKPDLFRACPSCGYRSAHIDSNDGRYLIIDSSLPDLITRYRELLSRSDDLVVLIDRRVSHASIAGKERRRSCEAVG